MYFIRLDLEYLLYLLVPYAIVPEAGVPLLVFEAKQQDLLHESEPGLLAVPLLLLLFLNCILVHLSGGIFKRPHFYCVYKLAIHLLSFGLATPLHQPFSPLHYDGRTICNCLDSNKLTMA